MWNNHLKVAYRNLLKNKIFSVINILGLSLAMMACLMILKHVSHELSYDNFRKPTVYRIVDYAFLNGELVGERAQTAPALAPALLREIPEVVQSSRLVHTAPLMSDPVMKAGERSFHEERIYFADPVILDLLSFQLQSGHHDHALDQPNQVVISDRMAEKYFPGQDAVGQTIIFYMGEGGNKQLTITGIFKDVPDNSHIHTDFIVSFSTIPWNLDDDWNWGNFYTYIELLPDHELSQVKRKMSGVLEKYLGETLAEWSKSGYHTELDLQQIQKIHLDSNMEAEAEANGSRSTVTYLIIIAIFILTIAWVNFINLTTAKSFERSKEIGLRKIMGSTKKQLIAQLLTESFLVNVLAAVLALFLGQLLMPTFQLFTNGNFNTNFDFNIVLFSGLLFLTGTIFSGVYPALALTSFQPIQMVKGTFNNPKQGVSFRKGLVVFQFTASIALIVGTLGIRQQLNFLQTQDKGLDMGQTLIIKGPGIKDSTYQHHLEFFKSEVKNLASVQEVSVSSNVPGKELSWAREFYKPAEIANSKGISIIAIDEEFLHLYSANFLAGRNFSNEIASDQGALVFNETAIRQLGFNKAEEAVGQTIVWHESDNDTHSKTIIGVIGDFNQESLHKKVGPIVFALKENLMAPWAGEYFSLKIKTSDYPVALKQIHAEWDRAFLDSPFDYFFLDDYFNRQHAGDEQFAKIFSLFSGLAIIIACLGLFGLTSYITLQRTKEIGIRKVLGASVIEITTLLSKSFLKLILWGWIIALPLSWALLNKWLDNFAYKIEIEWWYGIGAGAMAMMIAFMTVSFQSVKTALMNPVDSLRSE